MIKRKKRVSLFDSFFVFPRIKLRDSREYYLEETQTLRRLISRATRCKVTSVVKLLFSSLSSL